MLHAMSCCVMLLLLLLLSLFPYIFAFLYIDLATQCDNTSLSLLQKVLLERHRNIHARGFIEKRKKRDMYFNGSDAACGVAGCRFSMVKQRHHHCKLCGWACSSVSYSNII